MPRYVRECDLCSATGIAIRALVMGVLWSLPVMTVIFPCWTIISAISVSGSTAVIVAPILLVAAAAFSCILPIAWTKAHHHHLTTIRRLGIAALAYSIGLFWYSILNGTILVLSSGPGSFVGQSFLVIPVIASPIAFCVFFFYWKRFRKFDPVVIVRWPPLCGQCGYNLIGMESMKCPECGAYFRPEDFGLNESEFLIRSEATRAAVDAAQSRA